jgi:hypothetical protein
MCDCPCIDTNTQPYQRKEQHTKEISKKITIIIHLFTPTARFFTARTTGVFRIAQNKATGSHFSTSRHFRFDC